MANDDPAYEGKKEACKTFVEQTKLLMSLASAFVIAPAAIQSFVKLPVTGVVIAAEVFFVISVVLSYVVLGTISGTQNQGKFDVYNSGTTWFGRLQFVAYVVGLALFGYWFLKTDFSTRNPSEPPPVTQQSTGITTKSDTQVPPPGTTVAARAQVGCKP